MENRLRPRPEAFRASRDHAHVSAVGERSARVSTLELFFDLVFVFAITQLTGVLVAGADAESAAQVAILLALVWWMYDGYAWLTNAISTDRVRFRLLLLGGMGCFLVIALAIPHAYDGDGLAFGLAYLAVVALHTAMYMRGASVAEAQAMLRLGSYNIVTAGLVLVGGAVGGSSQWVVWTVACLVWLTPWLSGIEDLVISVPHFVERHGLVVIIALGESVVVIGVGATGSALDRGLVGAALLALGLSASLWWTYFGGEAEVERALEETAPARRPSLALVGFGYWHYGLLLGVAALAAGLKETVAHPYDPLDGWVAGELAVGVALFLACDLGFRRTLALERRHMRLAAVVAAVVTLPLGIGLAAAVQLAALVAVVVLALALEASSPGRPSLT